MKNQTMCVSVKILGTGCPKCKQTMQIVQDVVKENDISACIEKVDDIMEIMKYNIMSTPAVLINEEIVVKGRVPSKKEMKKLLEENTPIDNENGSDCCCSDTNCC